MIFRARSFLIVSEPFLTELCRLLTNDEQIGAGKKDFRKEFIFKISFRFLILRIWKDENYILLYIMKMILFFIRRYSYNIVPL